MADNDSDPPTDQDNPSNSESSEGVIEKINVADEIKNSFLDYSMSVIISRALPDVRDGLKPSQRRILFAMHDLSLYPNRKHRKCAKICGDTSGNYHPHGEAVIYPTLVHMAQPWVMRERLIDGQGNFGSVEGDPPAAMRYTEARMTHLGAILMDDMDKDTVDFVPNYDETLTEPVVFPAAHPNLLVNGGTGIAVGMATNIPPHNLGEVIDGTIALIENPALKVLDLLEYIKGPDFPTGCRICGLDSIKKYAETGRGSLKVRATLAAEETPSGREQIIVTEIPFGVNRATLVEKIAALVNDKILTDIVGLRDESDENTRVVVELKRDAIPKVVINQLYKFTQLESSFSANMLAIDHQRPKILNIKEILNCFIEHRREVVLRRTRFELRKAEQRAEILEGFLIALDNLDDFIRIIRESKNRDEARSRLMAYSFTRLVVEALGIHIRNESRIVEGNYALSKAQANAILELRLYQLTGMEQDKTRKEYTELIEKIKDLQDILDKESRVMTLIREGLLLVKDKFANPRKTQIVPDEGEIALEDLIANEPVIITLTHNGNIKRTNISEYKAQKRGGRGVIGMVTKVKKTIEKEKPDFIEHLFTAGTHDYLMFFTDTGRVFVERVHEVPNMARTAKGRNIANLLELQAGEKIAAMIRVISSINEDGADVTLRQPLFLLFTTRNGTVKKTALEDFVNVRRGGIIAIRIAEENSLIDVKLTSGDNQVVLITRGGKSIRFSENNVRSMGRATAGVRGIRLAEDDAVVASSLVEEDSTLLVLAELGIGKRTQFAEYRLQSRGGKGIRTMKTTEKTGKVVGALTVKHEDEIMLLTEKGLMVRTAVGDIRETGRVTQGVKLINLNAGDLLQAAAPVLPDENEGNDDSEETADSENGGESEAVADSDDTPPEES